MVAGLGPRASAATPDRAAAADVVVIAVPQDEIGKVST